MDISKYSGCVNTLPQNIVLKLPKTAMMLLDVMVDMIYRSGQRSGRQRGYITPSEKWLAKRVCRSRSWVSQNIKLLESLKIIKIVRRRKTRGKWNTNLYTLGSRLRNRTSHVIESGKKFLGSLLSGNSHRVKFSKNIVIPQINSIKKVVGNRSNNLEKVGPPKRKSLSQINEELKKYLMELSAKYGTMPNP
ncbi:MAG: hypothetical protein ACUVQ9_12905 [Thermodesulfobacteriota bacterium]